ncbi:FAD-dependent oxidoreductase [Brevibacillus ginsengisoli]|uniref:FAD-dependent oxidoreductase n=1 Tax=Brevibacillus ginsengisoli TaxID=363854 RepID=UPI003CF27452
MFDIAIIGAGPTGASAALLAAKAGKKTLLIDSDQSITKRGLYKNYYGIEEITGPELVETGIKQATHFGAEYIQGKVENIAKADSGYRLELENEQFEAQHVIFATGLMVDLAEKAGLHTKPGTEPRVKTIIDVDRDGRTSLEGIWAAGAVAGCSLHAVITAGDGAKVAINIISQLNGERYVDHDVLK